MMAGKHYDLALAQARVNARSSGMPRFLWLSDGAWYVEKTPPDLGSVHCTISEYERVLPDGNVYWVRAERKVHNEDQT